MDLIEQLGGYDKASEDFKKLHLNLKEQQKSNKIFMDAFDALKTELLEYRRQHNIFEVGDLVTYKAHFKGMWREGFGKITEIDEDLEIVNIDENVGVAISEIEHATDAEIKAGKRLEVESEN